MSTETTDLSGLSSAMIELVARTVSGVVAVKSAAYRVVSGVSLRDDLIAVTDHTLRREERVPVQTADGAQYTASVVGRDPGVDVAVLRVEGAKLKPIPPQGPERLKVGMLAAVVGLTTDAGPTASLGILGAVGGARSTWRNGTLDQFLRLDVNVYPSQAGAAVVGADGGLIGMATPVLLRHSAVAVPVATLNRVADELLKQGRIRQGYLGVGLQPVGIPESLRVKSGVAQESGLILLSVEANSPAEAAGLQLGDILISLNGRAVEDVEGLQNGLRGDSVGRTVKLTLLRGGERVDTEITISERTRRAN